MVVVSVRIASIVLGEAHGGTEHVNGKCNRHQEPMVLEPFRCVNLVGEENAECRGETESHQVGKAIELSAEFGTGVHEAGGKAIKLIKKGAQHDEIGTHADLVCRTKRTKCSGCPANGEHAKQKVQACESIRQNKA